METTISKDIPVVRAILGIKAASYCPVILGYHVSGNSTENTVKCCGISNNASCNRCEIRDLLVRREVIEN